MLEVLDSKVGEINIKHTPNRNDPAVQATERTLKVVSAFSSREQTSGTKFEVAGDFDVNTTLSTGETRVLKVWYCQGS